MQREEAAINAGELSAEKIIKGAANAVKATKYAHALITFICYHSHPLFCDV